MMVSTEKKSASAPDALSPEELRPRRAGSPLCWAKTVTMQDVAHACRRDGDTELGALPDDAERAPARVPPSEAEDESDDVRIKCVASTLVTVRIGPVPRQELPVPAHERGWRHEEGGPPLTREQSCQRCEQSMIGGGVPRARDLPTRYGELMTKHRDLDVLLVRSRTDSKQFEQPSTKRKVIGLFTSMIVADLRNCWSAFESRACSLQGAVRRRTGCDLPAAK